MAVNALQASPSASLEEESQGFPAYSSDPEIREASLTISSLCIRCWHSCTVLL